MMMAPRSLYMVALCAVRLFAGPKIAANPAVRIDNLEIGEVSNGCGDFFGICKPSKEVINYIFATSPNGNAMTIKINGVIHFVTQTYEWNTFNGEHRDFKIGDRYIRRYADRDVHICIDCVIDGILGEGVFYKGKMRVQIGNTVKNLKVCGAGGC